MLVDGSLAGAQDAGPREDEDRCPECGTRNAPRYRYCRNCVAALR